MRQISGEYWRLPSFLTGLWSVGAVAAFLLFFLPQSCADATEADGLAAALVTPDQDNAKVCEDYFKKRKPGLPRGGDYDYQEQYTIKALCKSGSANLSLLVDGAVADDIAAGDAL